MQNILSSAQVLYQVLSLRGKLILAFVILALIPMTAIEYYADSVARDLINKSTQQNLVKTSNQTALQIDLYISSQMNSIRTEAQVPFLSNYLKLAPTERTGSIQEINAKQILVIFSRKDPAFIKSYALLDQRGVNLLDTNGNQVRDQEGGFDYFKKAFASGLPFASSILFQNGNVFYISAAVRNENGVIIGVLRAKYDAAIIQSMVLDIPPIQGNSDFLSVIDKNTYVRLADTGGAENLYKSLKSFSAVEILDLQSRNLLPVGKPDAVISASDKFVSGFDRLSQEPFFTTYSDSIQTDALMTGTPLTTVPWVVIEGRSQAALSQPVNEQRRTALMLAFLILTVAVFAALWVSQIIAKPVVNLISIAQRVSAGDLEASAPVLSNDEVGTLARAFNTMTEKLRQTLAGLHDELKERKHAEGILLQFRRVMDESSDAIYFIDPEDGRYIDFNKSAYEWLGYTREELTQISIVDVAQHITNLQSWHERVEMVREKGVLIFETSYRRKDGSVFPVEVSARMLDYENRKILLGIVRDGTERKRSENALRESEEKFRKMFHSSPIAICISTLDDGRVIDANYAYWDLTGLDPQIAIGKNLVELNIWSDLHERDEFVAKLKLKRSYYDSDSNFIDHNGNMKSTLAFYEIIEIGGQERILSMFYDMSAQKATMQALQQSEVRTRALLEAMPDTIMEISLDGLIINMVPPKGTESAMPPENFIGRQVYEVLSEKAAFQTLLAVERALETNHIHTFEFEAVMGHQTQVMEARVVASVSDTAIVIIRDITQSKWVEAEREKLIRDLEVANRESETLRESLAGIVTTYDLSEVFNRILDQMRIVIPYDSASVWRVDGEWQTVIISRDLPPEVAVADLKFRIDLDNSSRPLLLGEKPFILNNNVQAELVDFQGPHSYINSWLAVPLKIKGKIIGLIALDGRRKGLFNEHHAELAVTFANQAAVALENLSLFSELQTELTTREGLIKKLEEKNAEAETMRESLASIVGTFEFSEIVQRILDQIRRVVPYDSASVWRLEGAMQIFIGGRDLPPELYSLGMQFKLDDENHALPILSGDLPYMISNNVQSEFPSFQIPPHTYINSWLGVPLRVRGRVIGLIALDGASKSQFNEHHAGLAVTFADQVAIALENARLFAELQDELQKQIALRSASAAISSSLHLEQVLSEICRQMGVILDGTSAYIAEYDKTYSAYTVVAEYMSSTANSNEMVSDLGLTYYVKDGAWLFDESITMDYVVRHADDNDLHPWTGEMISQYSGKTILYIPLYVQGRLLGHAELWDSRSHREFTRDEISFCRAISQQAAIAIANANLFEQLQKELAERKSLIAELESKNAELERFTYTVSHDLKSPLFTIRGFLGYLEQDALAGKQERVKSDMQRITAATEKMQMLLNDLLELSRVGRLKNESVEIPFEDLVHDALELVHGRIVEIGVAVHIDADLPIIFGDRQRLLEVLQNLIDNACKFMGNQKEPRIEIGQAGVENDKPIFYVRDNGIGIPPEHYDRVFGLFNKLDVKSDGTGIGLALVKRIVEVHGGRIWVESEAGNGSTFFFTLLAHPEEKSAGV